ncbi:hypothetical protein ACFZC5_17945 [Nocardia gamkensis]|uniref:hypothetical protein n=1 Tax=Nocardia gamkensis TaxID=352869 RepID=UPI0036E5B803
MKFRNELLTAATVGSHYRAGSRVAVTVKEKNAMMGMRKSLAVLAAATAMLGVGAAMAPAADAASGGTAPACIARSVHYYPNYVLVVNNCGKTMRVNVVFDYQADSGCRTLANGTSFAAEFAWPGRYNRTVVC